MRKVTIKLGIIILSKFIVMNSENKVLKFETLYKNTLNMFPFEANIWGFVFTGTLQHSTLYTGIPSHEKNLLGCYGSFSCCTRDSDISKVLAMYTLW